MNQDQSNFPSADGTANNAPAFLPLYQQIKILLVQSLEQGEWKPGEVIPSEMDLAARMKVSQGTVRKAIDELAAEHLLVRRQGKGTFVATHNEARAQFRFLRLMPDNGEPTHPESHVLECQRVRVNADIAGALQLPVGDGVLLIRRVLSFSGRPTIYEEIYLPAQSFKGLNAERLRAYRGPMYALFETEFDVRMIRAEEKIRAVMPSVEIAEHLNMVDSQAVLWVERISQTYADRPVEVRRGWYRTDAHFYHNTLT